MPAIYFITIAIVSFITLLFELLQTRILSVVFWHQIVYLAVSNALLGFGISGTICAVNRFRSRRALIAASIAGMGIACVAAYFVTADLPKLNPLLSILICYPLYMVPFIFAGTAISTLLATRRLSVGKLYAADLVAGSIACALVSIILSSLGPRLAIAIACALCGALSIVWSRRRYKFATALGALAVLASAALAAAPINVIPAMQNKEELVCLREPNAQVQWSRWTPICRIDVVGSPTQLLAPSAYGISMDAPADWYKNIYQDGTAWTRIFKKDAIDHIIDDVHANRSFDLRCVPYTFKHTPDVAVLGVGGGIDIIYALAYSANSVMAAEINPATYDLLTHALVGYTGGKLQDPRVHLFNEEARAMIRRLGKKFDLINVSGTDTFAADSAGAFGLSENYLYTVESMKELISALKPGGILSFTRYLDGSPPPEALRLCAMLCEGLRLCGVADIGKSIVVLAPPDSWWNCMVKNGAFTSQEIDTIKKVAEQRHLRLIYNPLDKHPAMAAKVESDDLAQYFRQVIQSYDTRTERSFFSSFPYKIEPSTDDSPFYYFHEPKSEADAGKLQGWAKKSITTVLGIVFGESLLLSCFAILLPLWVFKRRGLNVANAYGYAVYFACLGFGFMLIEMCLIQKLVLLLGNPLYALSVVLSALLLSAGIGSFIQSKINLPICKALTISTTLLLAFLIGLIFALSPIIQSGLHLPMALKVLLAGSLLFPGGVGFPLLHGQ